MLNIDMLGTRVIDKVSSESDAALVVSKDDSLSYLWKIYFL